MKRSRNELHRRIIVTGTSIENGRGGLYAAVRGFVKALERQDWLATFIATHRRDVRLGAFVPWLRALTKIGAIVRRVKADEGVAIVYAHAGPWFSLFRESTVLLIARYAGATTVLQLHSGSLERYLSSALGRMYLRCTLAAADRCYVMTAAWKEQLFAAGIHASISVIPNFIEIDSPLMTTPPCERKPHEDVVVGSLARLVEGKGLDLAIEAMTHMPPNYKLRIAGDGPLLGMLHKLVRKLYLDDRVEFLGWMDDRDKVDFLREIDVLLLPSRSEGFGLVFIEAMSQEVPIVAYRTDSTGCVVDDGRNGLLIKEYKAVAVAEALSKLSRSELRETFGRAGKRKVENVYSERRVLSDLMSDLSELLAVAH